MAIGKPIVMRGRKQQCLVHRVDSKFWPIGKTKTESAARTADSVTPSMKDRLLER